MAILNNNNSVKHHSRSSLDDNNSHYHRHGNSVEVIDRPLLNNSSNSSSGATIRVYGSSSRPTRLHPSSSASTIKQTNHRNHHHNHNFLFNKMNRLRRYTDNDDDDDYETVMIQEVVRSVVPSNGNNNSNGNDGMAVAESSSSGMDHSSIFDSKSTKSRNKSIASSKSSSRGDNLVKNKYSPNKSTLGLELVASPSLLNIGNSHNISNNHNNHDDDYDNVHRELKYAKSNDNSTLSSTKSMRMQSRSSGRIVDGTSPLRRLHNPQLGNNNNNNNTTSSAAASNDKDDIFDDESTYSAMATVAGNSTVVSKQHSFLASTKSKRTARVLAETTEAALLANELRDPNGPSVGVVGKNKKKGTLAKELRRDPSSSTKTKKEIQLANELRDPIAIQPTYSMRSIKTSEGMEVDRFDYFNLQKEVLGSDGDDAGMEKKRGGGKMMNGNGKMNHLLQPFDEEGGGTAASKVQADGIATSKEKQPTQSCLKPSSFKGEQQHSTNATTAATTTSSSSSLLVNPTTLQRNRSNRFSSKFQRLGTINEPLSSSTTTNSQNNAPSKDSIPCFSAPVASVSFADDLEQQHEDHPMDETITHRNNNNNKFNKSTSTNKKEEETRQFSPIAVNQFFAPEILEEDIIMSRGGGDVGRATNSNITNRLARNRQALKSIALAKGSAKDAGRKEKQAAALARGKNVETSLEKNEGVEARANDVIDVNDATKGSNVSIAPPLSPMEQEGTTPVIVQSVSDLDIPQFSPSLEANNNAVAKQQQQQRVDSPVDEGQEVDELTLLNTSDASMNSKKRRFLLPRLLGGRKAKDDGSSSTKSPKRSQGKDTTDGSNGGSTSNNKKSPKRSMRSKLFGSSKKKEQVKKEKVNSSTSSEVKDGIESNKRAVSNRDGETKPLSTEELEAIKEVEKYTAWLAPSSTPPEIKEVEKYTAWLAASNSTSPSKAAQEEPPQSPAPSTPESTPQRETSTPSTASIPLQERAPSMSAAIAAAAMQSVDDLSTIVGVEPPKADDSTVVEKDVVIRTMANDDANAVVVSKSKPISFFGARARSTSTKASTNSKASKASTVSKASSSRSLLSRSPSRASVVEPTAIEIPLKVNGKEAKALLDSGAVVESSGGETQVSDANAAVASTSNVESAPDNSPEVKKPTIGASAVNAMKNILPDFGFVGADTSGEVEAGVEVEWGVSVMEKNEFGDEGIALDMTAVNAELERTLSEPKWDNHSKVTDDVSWPSMAASRQSTFERKPSIGNKSMDALSEAGASTTTDNRYISNEEASTVSGATKPSLLHPIKLFKKRSRSRDNRKSLKPDDSNEETVFTKDEETVFSKDEETVFSKDEETVLSKEVDARKRRPPHLAQKRRYLKYRSRKFKDDSRSIEDDSDYSSSDYSSYDEDGEREDVVGTIATSLHKGLTGIVDMMETAFAFNKDEETIVSVSESSEGSEEDTLDDEDSYIQRKMARRRNNQRRLLHESRRSSSHRQHYQRKKTSQSNSRDDDESLLSEEAHRRGKKSQSSRKLVSSGRARNRRR